MDRSDFPLGSAHHAHIDQSQPWLRKQKSVVHERVLGARQNRAEWRWRGLRVFTPTCAVGGA